VGAGWKSGTKIAFVFQYELEVSAKQKYRLESSLDEAQLVGDNEGNDLLISQ
jgi:hypothetical protein